MPAICEPRAGNRGRRAHPPEVGLHTMGSGMTPRACADKIGMHEDTARLWRFQREAANPPRGGRAWQAKHAYAMIANGVKPIDFL
jgi:hypothetical protein